jgi:hypothetical protein
MITESSWIERCPECETLFLVEERGGGRPARERKPVDCPGCSHVVKERASSGVFFTRELGDEEIEQYEAMKNRGSKRPRS